MLSLKKKKNLEKRRARHLKKGRACQEDHSNKKIEVCDKIMSSFKVTHLFTSSKVSCKNVCTTRQITKEVKL